MGLCHKGQGEPTQQGPAFCQQCHAYAALMPRLTLPMLLHLSLQAAPTDGISQSIFAKRPAQLQLSSPTQATPHSSTMRGIAAAKSQIPSPSPAAQRDPQDPPPPAQKVSLLGDLRKAKPVSQRSWHPGMSCYAWVNCQLPCVRSQPGRRPSCSALRFTRWN